MSVLCLGREESRNAFKYMVRLERVDPLIVQESDQKDGKSKDIRPPSFETRRLKRGAVFGEWVQGAWQTVKNFFTNLFRSNRGSVRVPLPDDVEIIGSGTERCRTKAAPDGLEVEGAPVRSKRQSGRKDPRKYQYDDMFMTPFEFIQTSDGKVLEIMFAEREKDETVKNFKKHIADAFATKVRPTSDKVIESSPIGEHLTKYEYIVDNGLNGNVNTRVM